MAEKFIHINVAAKIPTLADCVKLKAGQFPVPLKMVENRTVGATLGEKAVDASIFAGAIGLAGVVLFMFFNYRFPGLVANIALVI